MFNKTSRISICMAGFRSIALNMKRLVKLLSETNFKGRTRLAALWEGLDNGQEKDSGVEKRAKKATQLDADLRHSAAPKSSDLALWALLSNTLTVKT
jgi:hypothetical protein